MNDNLANKSIKKVNSRDLFLEQVPCGEDDKVLL